MTLTYQIGKLLVQSAIEGRHIHSTLVGFLYGSPNGFCKFQQKLNLGSCASEFIA